MALSYFDVISMIFHNFDYISSEDAIYSLLGRGNLKDVTTEEDQDPNFPIPFHAKVFNFEVKESYLGILEVDFSKSNRLLNSRILLHFGAMENQIKAKKFYETNLLPYIKNEVGNVESVANPKIYGYTFYPKKLEVTARWVIGMPSVSTYLTSLDKCNFPS